MTNEDWEQAHLEVEKLNEIAMNRSSREWFTYVNTYYDKDVFDIGNKTE